MNEPPRPRARPEQVRSLQEAIRRLQALDADRADASASIRDTQRARLELLAEELRDVFAAVPAEDDQFSFAVQAVDPPRLWIDVTSHVALARDHRTYRFVKDTRLGRVVLAESPDRAVIADAVTTYVAERVLERRRALEQDWARDAKRRTGDPARGEPRGAPKAVAAPERGRPPRRSASGWFLLIVTHLVMAALGAAALYAYAVWRGIVAPPPGWGG